MNPADLARQNAIPLEVKKDGLQQRQNGDWVLRFVVQAADMDQRLTSAAMGTRFQVALVEIGDDEMPKQKGKMDWREMQPAAQAAIRCNEATFWAYLREVQAYPDVESPETATVAVRHLCKVSSRAELGTNHKARVLWHQLDESFQAWKLVSA